MPRKVKRKMVRRPKRRVFKSRIPRSMSRKVHLVHTKATLAGLYAKLNNASSRALLGSVNNSILQNNAYGINFALGDIGSSTGGFSQAFQMFRLNCVVVKFTPTFNVNQIAVVSSTPSNGLSNTQDWYTLTSPDASTQDGIISGFSNAVGSINAFEKCKTRTWNKTQRVKVFPKMQNAVLQVNGSSTIQAVAATKNSWLLSCYQNPVVHYGLTVVFPQLGATYTAFNYWDVTCVYYLSCKGIY
nr:MAG: capsid protein [Cressdnaviricota sp.]